METHLLYGLAWASFGLGHSVLAGPGVQRRLAPALGPYTRLAYNLFALLHIALVMAAGRFLLAETAPFPIPPGAGYALLGIHLLGWVLLLAALREYDLGLFAGTRQIRDHRQAVAKPQDEALITGRLHAFVRHPLYSGAFLILWGGADSQYGLATALWGSLYLFIGTYFEERKLLALYGGAYGDYRKRVPAFIPWKGRAG